MTQTSAIMLLILGIIFLLIAFSGSSEPKYINQREDYYDDEEDYDDEYEYEKVQDITESEVVKKTDDEETYVSDLINELKNKSDKSQKDKDKIGLLEIKLKQLKNKR
jgi:hypothetical protein